MIENLCVTGSTSDISLGCWEHPPFLGRDEDHGYVEGVFWQYVLLSLRHCCETSLKALNFFEKDANCNSWYDNEQNTVLEGLTRHHVLMPVTRFSMFDHSEQHIFIPLIASPGALILTSLTHNKSVQQLGIVLEGWPLLVIIIVSTGFAGVIIWLLDRMKNPQEFPRPFLKGFWEGTWWAFVSMTTVGYGDRSPKSIAGRIFSTFWIIFGLCVISMFTATITTALSQGNFSDHKSGYLSFNVAVLNGSYETILAYEKGSNVTKIKSIEDLLQISGRGLKAYDSVNNKTNPLIRLSATTDPSGPHAILMEHFMYGHLKKAHGEDLKDLKPELMIEKSSERGILLHNFTKPAVNCIRSFLASRQFSIYEDMIALNHGHSDKPNMVTSVSIARQLFSLEDKYKLLVAGVTLVIILILLFIWEIVYWRPRNPDYQYIESNWKFERNKRATMEQQELNFRRYYKASKRMSGSLVAQSSHDSGNTQETGTPLIADSIGLTALNNNAKQQPTPTHSANKIKLKQLYRQTSLESNALSASSSVQNSVHASRNKDNVSQMNQPHKIDEDIEEYDSETVPLNRGIQETSCGLYNGKVSP